MDVSLPLSKFMLTTIFPKIENCKHNVFSYLNRKILLDIFAIEHFITIPKNSDCFGWSLPSMKIVGRIVHCTYIWDPWLHATTNLQGLFLGIILWLILTHRRQNTKLSFLMYAGPFAILGSQEEGKESFQSHQSCGWKMFMLKIPVVICSISKNAQRPVVTHAKSQWNGDSFYFMD